MASVPMAPNDSLDDLSRTERDDIEEEHIGRECNKDASDSDATVNIYFQKALLKIEEIQHRRNLWPPSTTGS